MGGYMCGLIGHNHKSHGEANLCMALQQPGHPEGRTAVDALCRGEAGVAVRAVHETEEDTQAKGEVMPLFEVAIIRKPTVKEQDDGGVEELVFGPTAVIASDSQSAAISAVTKSEKPVDMQRCEVLVRPFV